MWNPKNYDLFEKERMMPIMDLISHVGNKEVRDIIDLGCGSGLSTLALAKKWPQARIVGVDSSNEMLDKARERINKVEYQNHDCNMEIKDMGKYDLVFSSAMIQWLRDQEGFVRQMDRLRKKDGVVAVQIPDFDHMEIRNCIIDIGKKYKIHPKDIQNISPHNATIGEYYDMFASCYRDVESYLICYQHVLNDHHQLVDFISSTALIPYRTTMRPQEYMEFEKELIQEVQRFYPRQRNGNILFEFKRIFVVAQ